MKNRLSELPDCFKKNLSRIVVTDTDLLSAKANEVLSDLKGSYLEQLKKDIPIMEDLLKKAHLVPLKERFDLIRNRFFVKVHDMKGQGATFGYPLLSFLGAYACDYVRDKETITLSDVKVLERIFKDIRLVFSESLLGDGGQKGEKIRKRWRTP